MITQKEIRFRILTDNRWLERAILAIYERQTRDEQLNENTKYDNGQGFNACDAPFLSSLAKWLLSNNHLSAKQVYIARKKMAKYCGQLVLIVREKKEKT